MNYLTARLEAEVLAKSPAERRMTRRLFDYWQALRGDRKWPALESFNPEAVPGFGANAFMLEFGDNPENPTFRFIGAALAKDCGQDLTKKAVSSVPSGTLLSRLTDNYGQVLVKQGPVQFEDGFVNAKGVKMLYRGIMLPFSRYKEADKIDYIVGAINCMTKSSETTLPSATSPSSATTPSSPSSQSAAAQALEPTRADVPTVTETETVSPALTESLRECQALARAVEESDSRSRDSLYRALEGIYAFYLKSEAEPQALDKLLKRAGLRRQARAPFSPVVKLVFGKEFDKSRLSEYASALSYARRSNQSAETVRQFIESQSGGLKGCVKAERAARRVDAGKRQDLADRARQVLRELAPLGEVADSGGDEGEFVLLLGRRSSERLGKVQVLNILAEKPSTVDAMLKRVAKRLVQEEGDSGPTAAARGVTAERSAASGESR